MKIFRIHPRYFIRENVTFICRKSCDVNQLIHIHGSAITVRNKILVQVDKKTSVDQIISYYSVSRVSRISVS